MADPRTQPSASAPPPLPSPLTSHLSPPPSLSTQETSSLSYPLPQPHPQLQASGQHTTTVPHYSFRPFDERGSTAHYPHPPPNPHTHPTQQKTFGMFVAALFLAPPSKSLAHNRKGFHSAVLPLGRIEDHKKHSSGALPCGLPPPSEFDQRHLCFRILRQPLRWHGMGYYLPTLMDSWCSG